jgi:hypothetical protein
MTDYAKVWGDRVAKELVGKAIVAVRYLTEEEREELGWYSRSVVIQLSDGTLLWPSQDDEGNGAGALFTTIEALPTVPVIP